MSTTQTYPRPANKTERARIISVFGQAMLPVIELFLDDIIDIYPFEQWNRDTHKFKYKTVGASKRQNMGFYCIGQDGNLYVKQAFRLFPVMEEKNEKNKIEN